MDSPCKRAGPGETAGDKFAAVAEGAKGPPFRPETPGATEARPLRALALVAARQHAASPCQNHGGGFGLLQAKKCRQAVSRDARLENGMKEEGTCIFN